MRELRRLSQRDLCDGFQCGDASLDTSFHRYAKLQEKRGQSATTLVTIDGVIAAFVTIVASGVDSARLTAMVKGLPRPPVPVLVLARMACDQRHQGAGLGAALLRDVVFAGALKMAADVGCVGIFVDAKPGAVGFYAKYGFAPLAPVAAAPTGAAAAADAAPAEDAAPTAMFLPLDTLRKAMRA